MEEVAFRRLVEVMARMAAGDRAAVFTLYAEFGDRIGGAVRRELRRVGAGATEADDLDGLVMDVCIELFACAGAWDPDGGALPWVWAERRVGQVVRRHVGQHHDGLDDERHDGGTGGRGGPGGEEVQRLESTEPEPLDVLAGLAGRDPRVALLQEGLERVGSRRDRAVLLEVAVQRSLGDTAPATTVGPLFEMRPDAVRQATKRMGDRLRDLAARDHRFAPLAELRLLA